MRSYFKSSRRINLHDTIRRGFLPPLLISLFCGHAFSEEGQWKYSSGFDYSSGDYNESTDTTMLYIPFGASYTLDSWTGKITTGWLRIDGPGNVVDDGVILPGGSRDGAESGIADTWAALSYEVESFPSELGFVDLTGKIKFPTADKDKGLGTGEIDYALQLDYAYAAGQLTPMVTVGYKFRGDPDGYDLNNALYLSAGGDWRYSNKVHLGASLDYQQASSDGYDDPLELFTYLTRKVNKNWVLSPYLYFGLSDSSADQGGGVQFVYKPSLRR